MNWTTRIFISLLIAAATVFAVWVVLGPWSPQQGLSMTLVVLFFFAAPIGALWMLYDCFTRERPSFAYYVFAFLPYAFVWHYLERVRRRK